MGKGGGSSSVGAGSMQAASAMFLGSNAARRAVFSQLSSAFATGGGKGFNSGFVRGAVSRSAEAGQAALRNAGAALPAGMDAGIRGRILNSISQTNKRATAGIAPGFANALIAQAPTAIMGASANQNAGFRVGAESEASAYEAAATRARGVSSALTSVAEPTGSWFQKYFRPTGS